MRIKFVYMVIFFTFVSLQGIHIFSNPQQSQAARCRRLLGSYRHLQSITPKSLPESEITQITDKRTCIKSYPWPAGIKAGDYQYLSAKEMKQIRDKVNETIKLYSIVSEETVEGIMEREISKGKPFSLELKVLIQFASGKNLELMNLYGDFLYQRKLQKEGRYLQSLESTEKLIKEYDMKVSNTSYDVTEEATYFSRQSLFNHIILLNFIAKSKMKPQNFEEGYNLVKDFQEKRKMLAPQIAISGDPIERMFYNIDVDFKKFIAEKRTTQRQQQQLKEYDLYNGKINGLLDKKTQAVIDKVKFRQKRLRELGFYSGNIDGVPGSRLIEAERAFVAKRSDNNTVFIHLPWNKGDIQLQIGKHRELISQSEMRRFLNGEGDLQTFDKFFNERQNDGQPLNFIILGDLFAHGPSPKQPNGLQLTSALKRRYSNKTRKFFFANDTEISKTNLRNLPSVNSAKDIAVVSEQSSFKVIDYDVIANIEAELKKAGIKVITENKEIESANIIFITGHKDQQFRKKIEELGSKGSLKDKVVVLFSCYEKGDVAFNSDMIRRISKARAVYFPTGKINPLAVEAVLRELSNIIKKNQAENSKIDSLLERCVDEAYKKETNTRLREEILKIRSAVKQLSLLSYPVNNIYG
jgi:hypothetical protein